MVEVLRSPSEAMGIGGRIAELKLASIDETAVLEQDTPNEKDPGFKKVTTQQRQPRRAFTSTSDYRTPGAPSTPRGHLEKGLSPSSRPSEQDSYFAIPTASRTPASRSPMTPQQHREQHSSSIPHYSQQPTPVGTSVPPGRGAGAAALAVRPLLPSPQRSYSVMDYEPIPFIQLPGEKLQIMHLPAEIHFAIFDWLDPIDSTCLGLASRHFYAIHRRMHGTVPLSARRQGPNDMEWAWRLAGPLLDLEKNKAQGITTTKAQEQAQADAVHAMAVKFQQQQHDREASHGSAATSSSLAALLPRGQVYCRKCGISRCELHKHIREWMPAGMEYCEVSQKFGRKAPDNARKTCYRSSPRHPHRCGRHTRQQRAVRLV
ncbi:F-box domain-containing protein [Apiospora rasikravindrae]|uniref:F-box domain-containing protein n=1 Tax=Apiospora rasikravindrae TaxID=990691 RepID=A0ABR1TEK8_9PEZI